MSDSWGGKVDEIKTRIKDAVGNAEGEVDADAVMTRIREAVGKAGSDIDTDTLMTRVKDVVGKAEGKVDVEKLRQWIDEVDHDKLKSWLDEAKTLGAGAVSLVEAQGEKLAERAPGAIDKLAGAAKEKLGTLTGDEGLASEGQIERLKGQTKETFAAAAEAAESGAEEAADAVDTKLEDTTDRR